MLEGKILAGDKKEKETFETPTAAQPDYFVDFSEFMLTHNHTHLPISSVDLSQEAGIHMDNRKFQSLSIFPG